VRRAAPPQGVRVDSTDPGPWARVAHGPRGLGLTAAPAPQGVELAPATDPLRPVKGVPFATNEAHIVADGGIAITAAPNVARTLRLADMAPLFDRRPPGLMRVAGAALANAGLLLDDAGWRAVVLPSLGDLASDLGQGPIAIRADGRRVAVVHEGAVYELELPGAATTQVEVDGTPAAIAYAHDGTLLSAVGAGLGTDPGDGSPIVALAAAAAAPRALARHGDGTCSLWDTDAGARIAAWTPGLLGPLSIALSANGEFASMGTPFADPAAACVVRAVDGAVVRYVDGARTIALHPQGKGMLVGGEWGALYLEPPREAE
jgi:hypothetical protein